MLLKGHILDLNKRPINNAVSVDCEKALAGLKDAQKVDLDFEACPLVRLPSQESPKTVSEEFQRRIPESLSVLMRLTGHPDGFFTGELRYLLKSAASYGYSLSEYSSARITSPAPSAR